MKFKKIVGFILLVLSVSKLVLAEDEQYEQYEEPQQAADEVLNAEKELTSEDTENILDAEKVLMSDETDDNSEVQEDTGIEMQDVKVQDTANKKEYVRHGDTIALQTFVRNFWASCGGLHCGRSGCPRMHMRGHDWTRCWGEVFRIYREKGSGVIQVGDRVGLYYPPQAGKWLGCFHGACGKYSCPGYPSGRHGFENSHKWHHCTGEVFRIYAKNKGHGACINSNDDVALYYERDRVWVSQGFHQMNKRTCLGKSLPPPLHKYDGCAFETFTLWKK